MYKYLAIIITTFLIQSACNQRVPVRFSEGYSTDVPTLRVLGYIEEDRFPIVVANRGGKRYEGYPENAIETFEYVLQQAPAIILCDVAMTADGVFILMHDEKLERTTTGEGTVSEKNWEKIQKLKLVDDFGTATEFEVPTLTDVLKWADKRRAILMLDLSTEMNDQAFGEMMELVKEEKAMDNVVLVSHDIENAKHIYEFEPQLKQSLPIEDSDDLKQFLDAGLPPAAIVANVGKSEADKDLYKQLHDLGVKAMVTASGKLDNKAVAHDDDVYIDLYDDGADIIITNRPVEAAEALEVFGTGRQDEKLKLKNKKK